jgi:hypothetical protein
MGDVMVSVNYSLVSPYLAEIEQNVVHPIQARVALGKLLGAACLEGGAHTFSAVKTFVALVIGGSLEKRTWSDVSSHGSRAAKIFIACLWSTTVGWIRPSSVVTVYERLSLRKTGPLNAIGDIFKNAMASNGVIRLGISAVITAGCARGLWVKFYAPKPSDPILDLLSDMPRGLIYGGVACGILGVGTLAVLALDEWIGSRYGCGGGDDD